MDLPGTSHNPNERPDLFPFEDETSRNLAASRIYQNALTSGSAQAHYGDRIMYGDSHVHHHVLSHEAGRPAPPRRPINTLRWRKDPQFVGREDTLASIKQILEQYGCVALTGAGGVGKSQTAIEFCWRWLEEQPHFNIIWIYAASIQAFDAGYGELARKLCLPCSSPGSSKDAVRDGVKDWLEDNSDWLMVIDNADTYGDFFGNADGEVYDAIRDALPLPHPGSAMILYTSRHARIGEELTEHHNLHIDNLSVHESRRLLITKLGTSISNEHASALLEALEYLPMSIAHAAAYLKFTKIPIQQYLARVKNDADFLDLLGSHHVHVGRRDGKAPRSVVKVILTTLDLLTLHNEHAANLLCFMACLDRQNIPAAITTFAIDERTASKRRSLAIDLPESQAELESSIGELESLALISRRVEGQSFTLHRLVHVTMSHCMMADRTQTAYLLLCAHCLMESFFPGVSILMMHYEDESRINAQQSDLEQAQQSLAKYPSGFKIGLRFLCKLGIFAHVEDDHYEVCDSTNRRVGWLKYICSSPLEAVLAAAKCDLEPDGNSSPLRLQSVQAMAELNAQRSFERLERLAAQTIQRSKAHSFSMVVAKVYLARAVAGIRLEMSRPPVTAQPVAALLLEAEQEADGIPYEQSDLPHTYYDHCSLAAIFLEAGCRAKAILLQERACDGLTRMFGPKDLDVLAYRVYLAELKGPYAIDYEELRNLEQNLQTWFDRMRGQLDLASANDRDALVAIDHIGRVKVLICRKYLANETISVKVGNEALSMAVRMTERILKESLLRMEKLGGVLDPATSQKTIQIHGFLTTMGPLGAAGDFAFERATALLEATSNRNLLTLGCASIITDGVKLFMQHSQLRPICERILFTLLRNLETQRSRGDIKSTAHVIRSTLELIRATRAQDSNIDPHLQATILFQHYAFCDRCDQYIIGIRHKCLQCPDYDICTPCLELDGPSDQDCSRTGAQPGPHQFAPMYENYDQRFLHREAVGWHTQVSPCETQTIPQAVRTDPGRYHVMPIHRRWHKHLTDDKGYESEPDEGRRTRTPYRKHYARRKTGWFDGVASRARSRSCESLKLAFVLSRL